MGKCIDTIELHHLCYFVTAAEHGSFRWAGAALGIQESAISRRIRDLEDRIGLSLFHRHSSGVFLTVAGERYLRHARRILRHVGECVTDAVKIDRSKEGRVRMGIFSSLASVFLP